MGQRAIGWVGWLVKATLLSAGLGLGGLAEAQVKSESALTEAAEEVVAEAEKKAAIPGGPQINYERFRRQVQVEVGQKREEQIGALTRLLELGTSEKEVPDLKFRIAELYADKARDFFFRSQEKDTAIFETNDEVEKSRLEAQKERDLEESKYWARSALNMYADIRENHADYERFPEVLFALGQAHWTAGEHEAALKPYADLIRDYPGDALLSEAWLAFGEYYFDEGDMMKALDSYKKAAEDKRSRVYGFAVYKQGWCFYNLADWDQALRAFETAVIYSQMAEELSGENKIALGREAQGDWVRTYVHIGGSERAKYEIERLLGVDECTARCVRLLEGLAGLWYEEGYFDASAYVYQELVVIDPDSFRNPLRQGRVVDLADRMGDKVRTVKASNALVSVFERARKQFEALTPDAEGRLTAESDLEEATIVSESTVRRLAQEWHREARKTRQDKTFARAESMYANYLSIFDDQRAAYLMRFQYADLLFKLERFDEAATNFETVVKQQPEGKYVVDAANDNILAVEEHLRDLRLELPTAKKVPASMHPQHERLLKAIDRYLKYVPPEKAEDTRPAVQLKGGRLQYAYNRLDDAVSRFENLIAEYPRSEQAVVAANLVVDVYNLKKDWTQLYASARRYLDNEALIANRPKLRQELTRFGEYAKFALVQSDYEKAQEDGTSLIPSAEAFVAFATEFPKSENADKALFNASVIFDTSLEKSRASELRTRLLRAYPDSSLRADVAFYEAQKLQERTEYLKAARALEAFAKEFPEDKRAANALFDASVLYAGTGQATTAASLREKYVENYGKSSEAEAVAFAIAVDLERAKKYRDAVRAYETFLKKYPKNEKRYYDALWRQAQLRRKLRDIRNAEKLEKKLLATVRYYQKRRRSVPANSLRYASLVAVKLLEDEKKEYDRLRVRKPSLRNPRPFRKSLAAKAQARDRLIKRYASIVTDYQQAEASLTALRNIADVWHDFATDLKRLPCPRGVSAEICTALRDQMETLSLPAMDSAVDALATCVDESNKLATYTDDSVACAKRLEKLAPDRAQPLMERVFAPTPSVPIRASTNVVTLAKASRAAEKSP